VTTPVADQPTTSTICGHVFVVRGLLESVACDEVIANGSSFRPHHTWFSVLGVEDGTAPTGGQTIESGHSPPTRITAPRGC
jgi:hypothetical protein